jgi:hypothetical protein
MVGLRSSPELPKRGENLADDLVTVDFFNKLYHSKVLFAKCFLNVRTVFHCAGRMRQLTKGRGQPISGSERKSSWLSSDIGKSGDNGQDRDPEHRDEQRAPVTQISSAREPLVINSGVTGCSVREIPTREGRSFLAQQAVACYAAIQRKDSIPTRRNALCMTRRTWRTCSRETFKSYPLPA